MEHPMEKPVEQLVQLPVEKETLHRQNQIQLQIMVITMTTPALVVGKV
jgi:hypothetical protein